jgi:2-polyprenyl-6-methoxyphenol hydroxylase-like FAD-dependent oxidoreductase
MRIVCLGGGPAGLYFSILMKQANPAAEITVLERNQAGQHLRLGHRVLRQDHGRLPSG